MPRILITGSRSWTSPDVISKAIADYITETKAKREDTILVHGACPRGADNMADQIARSWGITVEAYPADWRTHGRKAGFLRNEYMVSLGADILLAFIRNDSAGASHTVKLGAKAQLPTRIYRETS